MHIAEQIRNYMNGQPEPKRVELETLHRVITGLSPNCQLWFSDGKNSENKTVTNPGIGYGLYTIRYADGKSRPFYQVGISANKTGISVYLMGIDDKTFLPRTFGNKLGKASVTGYCIRFKTIADIDLDVLAAAIRYGFEASGQ